MDAETPATYVARLETAFDRMGRYLTSAAAAHLDEAPGPMLSGSQRTVLRDLADNGPRQVSEVAAHLGVTLSAATGLVDRLVKAKLVTRDRDQKDRRVVWVKATPDGVEAVKAAEQRRRAALSQLVSHLPEEDLSTLCAILERFDNP
ncbi:MAG TPA: MarR family transcriptional regulator [Candidatus Sulfotelmatobacter sp.]|nr:MarR family transcriptional regulator [Candidatus Sulfotelmatobacter sp.]